VQFDDQLLTHQIVLSTLLVAISSELSDT